MRVILLSLALLALSACGPSSSKKETAAHRSFPYVTVPDMMTDRYERSLYAMDHFWDGFFTGEWPTDSAYVHGVKDTELAGAVATYMEILHGLPVDKAQGSVAELFDKVEAVQAADTAGLFYLRMTEIVSNFLYEPSSPYRSEDLYLPFVKGMAESRFTREDLRNAYSYQLSVCSMNPYGSVVPDFTFRTASGRQGTLYGVEADFTMLFFSNPGCASCREIIDELQARPYIDSMIADGRLAVVNIYIDEDLPAWRKYEKEYPRNWINAYDPYQRINEGGLYNVRAIPSLYLLDAEKRVIFKDAPTERVLNFLDGIIQ